MNIPKDNKALKRALLFIFIFLFPTVALGQSRDREIYPQVDISGYKTWEYHGIQVKPQSNYSAGVTHLGFSPTLTSKPWQEKLQLSAVARITEKLSTTYNIEQQPGVPEHFDVKVNYDNVHELTFGDFSADFSGNEFATTTKLLNGMKYTGKTENYDIILVPASRLKSQLQERSEQSGNNTPGPYNLGHSSILEGSERIELNNVKLTRGQDYTINYFEGKITFAKILNQTDRFAYTYEYSNITDLYFPALSRNDFFGLQGRFKLDPATWGTKPILPRPSVKDAYQIFPTDQSEIADEEILEQEAAGRYYLKYVPVKPFSERVSFRGVTLIKDQDYKIDYEQGEITLFLSVMVSESEPLAISYEYYETGKESDNIAADGSRGPYDLTHQDIIVGSEKVSVDGKPVSGREYSLDYQAGKITFDYNISNTSSIIVNYQYMMLQQPTAAPPPPSPYQLTVGTTYLRESSRSSAGELTTNLTEIFSQKDLAANNNVINLTYFPLLPTLEGGTLLIKKNGLDLTEGIDYVVPATTKDPLSGTITVNPDIKLPFINDTKDPSDGWYSGTIKILTTIEATEEVTVFYTYSKNIVGRYTGGGNGSRGPYYLKGFHNIVPGSEILEVWNAGSLNSQIYVRNSSFESDAGDLGYAINYDKDQPYITFNKELLTDQKFTIYFQYLPPGLSAGSNIKRDVTGFDVDFKLGPDELLEFKGAFASSHSDQIRLSIKTWEAFTNFDPNITSPTIQLSFIPLIENTEKVYINNYLMNKDENFLIDYPSGKIVFYGISLSSQDAVVVEYDYEDPGGLPSSARQNDSAYKFELTSKLKDFTASYGQKQIGFNFEPLGVTALGVGSSQKDLSAAYASNWHKLNLGYHYKESNNPLEPVSGSSFSRNFERNYSLGLSPYNIIDLGASYQQIESGQAPKADSSISTEAEQKTIGANFQFMPLRSGALSCKLSGDIKGVDTINRPEAAASRTDYNHLNSTFFYTRRIQFSLDRQNSRSRNLDTALTAETSRTDAEDITYDLNLDLTYPQITKWTFYAKLLDHELKTTTPSVETLEITNNMTLHTDFIPNELISTSFNFNRQETPTVTVLGKNPLNQTFSSKLRITPAAYLSSEWLYNQNQSVLETGKEDQGQSNSYSLWWEMYSSKILKFQSSYKLSASINQTFYGTAETRTRLDSFAQDYSLTYQPLPLLTINPGLAYEYYKNETTGAALLEIQMQNPHCAVILEPYHWLNFRIDYSLKISTRLSDNINKHKKNLGFTATYNPYSWGTVIYNIEDEANGGEVTASGTLLETNYKKLLNKFSLNLNIPQQHPFLEAIIINLTYKNVSFRNQLAGREGDNFDASSLVFEGILNF